VGDSVADVVDAVRLLLDHPIPPARAAATVAHFSWGSNAAALERVFADIIGVKRRGGV
jgi:glycosyltransferase involved in cell wall biosynthesis